MSKRHWAMSQKCQGTIGRRKPESKFFCLWFFKNNLLLLGMLGETLGTSLLAILLQSFHVKI
jgi:hypothetical protein